MMRLIWLNDQICAVRCGCRTGQDTGCDGAGQVQLYVWVCSAPSPRLSIATELARGICSTWNIYTSYFSSLAGYSQIPVIAAIVAAVGHLGVGEISCPAQASTESPGCA